MDSMRENSLYRNVRYENNYFMSSILREHLSRHLKRMPDVKECESSDPATWRQTDTCEGEHPAFQLVLLKHFSLTIRTCSTGPIRSALIRFRHILNIVLLSAPILRQVKRKKHGQWKEWGHKMAEKEKKSAQHVVVLSTVCFSRFTYLKILPYQLARIQTLVQCS